MDMEMQVEIPVALYNHFAEQAEARNCTIELIVRETIQKFLDRSE